MDAAEAQSKAHSLALAELLYAEADPEQVKTLAGIEVAVHDYLLVHVGPEIGNFLSAQAAAQSVGESGTSRVSSDSVQIMQGSQLKKPSSTTLHT